MRRKRLFVYVLFSICFLTIWISRERGNTEYEYDFEFKLLDNIRLSMDVPKNVTYRRTLVQNYINNLQEQLPETQDYHGEHVMQTLEETYARRRKRIQEICKIIHQPKSTSASLRSQLCLLKRPKVLYCAVPKAGSTFWRRVMVVLKRKRPKLQSPFLLSYGDFNMASFLFNASLAGPGHNAELDILIDEHFKFMFSRDPYHRLFSTYVDKIIGPNTVFWSREARQAVKKVRGQSHYDGCGQDLTFVELVRYLNSLDTRRFNEHVIPASMKCDVCRVKYDVIGKMETFYDDVLYVLQRTSQLGSQVTFHDFSLEYKVDFIVDAVVRAFSLKHVNNSGWINCISSHAGNRRIWRQLQIAGLIDKSIRYPLTPPESNAVSVTEFVNLALDAFKKSPVSARQNKQEAYLQAYGQLSMEDLETLREKYLQDFLLFGYNDRPPELFNRRPHIEDDYDYFDLLKFT